MFTDRSIERLRTVIKIIIAQNLTRSLQFFVDVHFPALLLMSIRDSHPPEPAISSDFFLLIFNCY